MALELNQLVQIDYTAKYLWSTGKTGEYAAVDNEGGWGAPNSELNQSALGVIAVARDEARTVYGNVSPRWKYNSGATNADENQFQISYLKDSIIDVYMIRLMVSADHTITVDTVPIVLVEGHYYYYSQDSQVYKIENGVPVLVEDMLELIDALSTLATFDGDTTSILCSDAYVVKLSVEYGAWYKRYTILRKEGCDDIKGEFFRMLNFKEDIIGARRAYNSGLFSKAQSTIETLTEEQNIQ